MNKESADRGTKTKAVKNSSCKVSEHFPNSYLTSRTAEAEKTTPSQVSSEKTEPPSVGTLSAPSTSNQDGRDFFSAIEEEQPTIFNPQTNRSVLIILLFKKTNSTSTNVAYFQQPAANPFTRMVAAQPTGFLLPQATAVPAQSNPFSNFLTQPPQPTGQYSLSTFAHQQPNGIPPIPQPTGG